MKTSIIQVLCAGLFFSAAITGCSKTEAVSDLNNNPQQLKMSSTGTSDAASFESADGTSSSGMLNRNFSVSLASDGKMNMTEQFAGYTLKFSGTQPGGDAFVTTGQDTYAGTWNWRENTSMMILDYSGTMLSPAQSAYLSRTWTMQPSTSAYTMNLVAADGDQLQLAVTK